MRLIAVKIRYTYSIYTIYIYIFFFQLNFVTPTSIFDSLWDSLFEVTLSVGWCQIVWPACVLYIFTRNHLFSLWKIGQKSENIHWSDVLRIEMPRWSQTRTESQVQNDRKTTVTQINLVINISTFWMLGQQYQTAPGVSAVSWEHRKLSKQLKKNGSGSKGVDFCCCILKEESQFKLMDPSNLVLLLLILLTCAGDIFWARIDHWWKSKVCLIIVGDHVHIFVTSVYHLLKASPDGVAHQLTFSPFRLDGANKYLYWRACASTNLFFYSEQQGRGDKVMHVFWTMIPHVKDLMAILSITAVFRPSSSLCDLIA